MSSNSSSDQTPADTGRYHIRETTNYDGTYQLILKTDEETGVAQRAGFSVDGAAVEFSNGQAYLGGLRHGAKGVVRKSVRTLRVSEQSPGSANRNNYIIVIKTR